MQRANIPQYLSQDTIDERKRISIIERREVMAFSDLVNVGLRSAHNVGIECHKHEEGSYR